MHKIRVFGEKKRMENAIRQALILDCSSYKGGDWMYFVKQKFHRVVESINNV